MESPGLVDLIDEKKAEKMREDMEKYRRRHQSHLSDLDNMLANEMETTVESFGESIISEEERKRLERTYATDVHHRVPIHVCKGRITENSSRKRYEALQQERGLNGQIEELSRRLHDSMLAAVDKEVFTAEHGVLIPNKVWKATKCNNPKIFSRIDEMKLGGFVVQLLLDGLRQSQFAGRRDAQGCLCVDGDDQPARNPSAGRGFLQYQQSADSAAVPGF